MQIYKIIRYFPNLFCLFIVFSYICSMLIEDLKKRLVAMEAKFKNAKCNRCAERILKKCIAIKKQIECLEKKQSK